MSPGQPNTKPDRAELEAAIDALLAEIDTTCTKFENPQASEEDEDLAEYTKAMAATVTAAPAPPHAPPLEATAGVTDGPATAGAEAEQAIEGAEAATDDLLEAAADQLIEALEAEVAGVESPAEESNPQEPSAADVSNEDLLGQALDGLLDGPALDAESTPAPAEAPEPEPEPEPEQEPESKPEPVAADAFADLDAAFDELLEGSFESASGEAVDTAGVDTRPDPSLMLDPSGGAKPETAKPETAKPEPAKPEPASQNPQSVPEPELTSVSEPAVAVQTNAAAVSPEPAPIAPVVEATPGGAASVATVERPRTQAPSVKAKPWQRVVPMLGRVLVWARPRAAVLGGKLFALVKPLGAKALVLMSKPLEGKPPNVRDSIGWVAIWTLFLGLCVWGYAVLRPAQVPINDGRGTQVVTAETPAE